MENVHSESDKSRKKNLHCKIQKMKSVEKQKRCKSFSAGACPTQQNACIFQYKGKTPIKNQYRKFLNIDPLHWTLFL